MTPRAREVLFLLALLPQTRVEVMYYNTSWRTVKSTTTRLTEIKPDGSPSTPMTTRHDAACIEMDHGQLLVLIAVTR
ncbi:hypothetical protein GY45DRAFT_960037 [Cubamyces sp. BRFM 1775]|nr:hypothetical protein GY45DRAFT_960037 [Cubamyces sp. BRFM 1775]